MPYTMPRAGQIARCAVLGKDFVVERLGDRWNYATDRYGRLISDRGALLLTLAALEQRAGPVQAFVSLDGGSIINRDGFQVAAVVSAQAVPLARFDPHHGAQVTLYRVRAMDGRLWYGRSGRGLGIQLRPIDF